jgi:hypothetical protein
MLVNLKNRIYADLHKEQRRQYYREYQNKNREIIRLRKAKWRNNNKNYIKKYQYIYKR